MAAPVRLRPADSIAAAIVHLNRVDPVMARVIGEVGPCRYGVDRETSPFGALVSSIVYQQISGYAATAILGRLTALCGGTLDPAPIRAATDEALRGVGLSRQKIGYLRDLTEKADHTFDRRRLSRLSDEDVIETLTQVKGVGRWTAEMFLMFRLGRLDVFPVSDLGIRNAMARAYHKRGVPKPAWMHKQALAWSPYRTIASWYLWQSIDNVPAKPKRARKGKAA